MILSENKTKQKNQKQIVTKERRLGDPKGNWGESRMDGHFGGLGGCKLLYWEWMGSGALL